jgi:hypothetical protein
VATPQPFTRSLLLPAPPSCHPLHSAGTWEAWRVDAANITGLKAGCSGTGTNQECYVDISSAAVRDAMAWVGHRVMPGVCVGCVYSV